MSKITYTFHGATAARLASLNFEYTNSAQLAPGTNSGSIDIPIVGYLDIDIIVSGDNGADWDLYVEVEGSPIKAPSSDGFINGKISKGNTSHVRNSYDW